MNRIIFLIFFTSNLLFGGNVSDNSLSNDGFYTPELASKDHGQQNGSITLPTFFSMDQVISSSNNVIVCDANNDDFTLPDMFNVTSNYINLEINQNTGNVEALLNLSSKIYRIPIEISKSCYDKLSKFEVRDIENFIANRINSTGKLPAKLQIIENGNELGLIEFVSTITGEKYSSEQILIRTSETARTIKFYYVFH